jgi:hypothetical protein
LYAWGVESEDVLGNVSEAFTERHFTVFVGKTPTNAQFLTDTTPAFTWTALTGTGAATWRLQIAADPWMSFIVHQTTTPLPAATATYTLPNPAALTPGLYYWRVIRTSGADAALFSGQPFFVVSSLASITPAPMLPLTTEIFNAEEVAAGMDFVWTDLWQLGGPNITNYEIEIRQTLPTNPVYATIFPCNCEPYGVWPPVTTPEDGLYYWRVRGLFDIEGYAGPFSAWRTFRIDTTMPNAPALSLPVDMAVIPTTRTPTFKWAAAAGTPTRYVLEVSNTDDFTSIRYTATIPTPALATPTMSYTLPVSQALPNGIYYWRVTARDAAGNPVEINDAGTPATSLARRFTIAVP